MSGLSIWIDGAARGNPGLAAAAGVVKRNKATIAEWGIPLGVRTNNEAEYFGLILALSWLHRNREPATIYSDSQLIVEQATGKWKVKSGNLGLLNTEAKMLLKGLSAVNLINIPREKNREADRIGNLALDKNMMICDDQVKLLFEEILFKLRRQSTLFS